MKLRDKTMEWPDPPEIELKPEDSVYNLTIRTSPAINFSVEQSEWCGYNGECKKDMAMVWDICYLCKHRIKLDIPAMLDKEYEEQVSSKE